jgi:hypothetical protein
MPTVLDLLDVPLPATDGISLVEAMKGRQDDLNLEAYSESLYPERLGWSPIRALRDGRFKLIVAPRPELYDLVDDPFELRNVYDHRRDLAETMTARTMAIAKGREDAPGTRSVVTPEVQARLASLGYVASSAPDTSARMSLIDAKDCIGSLHDRDAARWQSACGTAARGIAFRRPLVSGP